MECDAAQWNAMRWNAVEWECHGGLKWKTWNLKHSSSIEAGKNLHVEQIVSHF